MKKLLILAWKKLISLNENSFILFLKNYLLFQSSSSEMCLRESFNTPAILLSIRNTEYASVNKNLLLKRVCHHCHITPNNIDCKYLTKSIIYIKKFLIFVWKNWFLLNRKNINSHCLNKSKLWTCNLYMQPYTIYAAHNTFKKVMQDLIFVKCFFLCYKIFLCPQITFVFHLQRDLFIVLEHIVAFFFFFFSE